MPTTQQRFYGTRIRTVTDPFVCHVERALTVNVFARLRSAMPNKNTGLR